MYLYGQSSDARSTDKLTIFIEAINYLKANDARKRSRRKL